MEANNRRLRTSLKLLVLAIGFMIIGLIINIVRLFL